MSSSMSWPWIKAASSPHRGPLGGRKTGAAGRLEARPGPWGEPAGRLQGSRTDAAPLPGSRLTKGTVVWRTGDCGPTHLQTPEPRPVSSGSHPPPSGPLEAVGWLLAACWWVSSSAARPSAPRRSWLQGPRGGGRRCGGEGGGGALLSSTRTADLCPQLRALGIQAEDPPHSALPAALSPPRAVWSQAPVQLPRASVCVSK